jgi:hypothetical protein
MMEFNPQIQKRDTEELIAIANSTTSEWQQAAIDQAREELNKRGITKEYEQKTILRWEEEQRRFELEYQNELEQNVSKTYSLFEMAGIFFSAPFILGGRQKWSNDLSLSELRQNNYKRKFRQRILLLISGTTFWVLFMLAGYAYYERKWQAEIDQADISEWENNYLGREGSQLNDTLLN